jgi:hypothetical protein
MIRNRELTDYPWRGKYAIVKLRNYPGDEYQVDRDKIDKALKVLEEEGMLEYGVPGTAGEFFVIMLKDRWADRGLQSYANAAAGADYPDYAADVETLARRAGPNSPFCKTPD